MISRMVFIFLALAAGASAFCAPLAYETGAFGQKIFKLSGSSIPQIDLSGDGSMVTSTSSLGHIFSADSGEVFFTQRRQYLSPAISVFSPNGSQVALGSLGHEVRILETDEFQNGFYLRNRDIGINPKQLLFHPNGQTLFVGDEVGTLQIWDISANERLHEWQAHGDEISAIAVSPDGAMIATVSGNDAIEAKVWNVETSELVHKINRNDENRSRYPGAFSAAFSPDGSILATGGGDGRVILWDTKTWNESSSFAAVGLEQISQVIGIAFVEDGRQIITAGFGQAIRLWDARTGHEIRAIIEGFDVTDFGVSDDGSRLAFSTRDGTVQIMDLPQLSSAAGWEQCQ